jgi:hypothetical protein
MPPSPKPPRFLLGKKEKHPRSPIEPALRPFSSKAPIAWAASSITAMPRSRATSMIGSMSAMRPYRWTGMMAFVRSVTAPATACGSML